MWISRTLEQKTNKGLKKGKVLALYGPRRTGKTSFLKKIIESHPGKIFVGTGDDIQIRELVASQNLSLIQSAFSNYDLIFIDEAQRIPEVGWGLKLMVDHFPDTIIIVTGSSSFELSGQIGEPLTGREKTLMMYPLAMMEIAQTQGNMAVVQKLNEYLVYGCYPEVITAQSLNEKREYLIELRNAYLFKDILELENLKNAAKLTELLKLIAFQIGQEVSLNELSNALGIAKQTVERYLNLLEKSFVIKKVSGFSRNLRKEIVKTARYYFLDNGVRNSVISSFNEVSSRNDMGMLWENFCFAERLKKQEYTDLFANNYFWRTYDRQELDMVEEKDGQLHGYEFKWSKKKKPKAPKAWTVNYPDASFEAITPENFMDFVL